MQRRIGPWATALGVAMVAIGLLAAPPAPTRAGIAPPPVLGNPFQCYEVKPRAFAPIPGVQVVDAFGLHVERVRFPHRLCAPAVMMAAPRGADPFGGEHLIGHVVSAPNVRVLDQVVENEFGSLRLDLLRPGVLLVPTLKSLTETPPPLPDPTLDHFQCYSVKRSRGTPRFVPIRDVHVVDQFGPAVVDLVRPVRLCAPANKNDEDPTAPDHPGHLLCYRTRGAGFGTVRAYTNSQFGPDDPLLIHRREVCVPSLRNPRPTTTSTTTTSTTMASSTTIPSSTTLPPIP